MLKALVPAHAWELGVDWKAVIILSVIHIVGIIGGGSCLALAFHIYTVSFAVVLFFLCHLSIRLGAHSLYTHRAYKAALVWHFVCILLYSANMQGALQVWGGDHVRHHVYTDTQRDPYSPKHGILWAHMLWPCFKSVPGVRALAAPWMLRGKTDAEKIIVALISWQSNNSISVGIATGILVPGLIASLWGDFWGGILVAGFLRLVVQYHATWQINSLSHLVGPQPYGQKNSSRNSPWWLCGIASLLSVGEASQHNRHHKFPKDFRTGVGYFALDIGKWVLYIAWGFSQILRALGLPPLVWDLCRFDENGTMTMLQ